MPRSFRSTLILGIIAAMVIALWWSMRPAGLPAGIVAGNGRIEATEINIATKTAGRIVDITAREGDFVRAGTVVARMDTQMLAAQQTEARAKVHEAENALKMAKSIVEQRQSEYAAAQAVVAQRRAEFDTANKHLVRSERLVGEGGHRGREIAGDTGAIGHRGGQGDGCALAGGYRR